MEKTTLPRRAVLVEEWLFLFYNGFAHWEQGVDNTNVPPIEIYEIIPAIYGENEMILIVLLTSINEIFQMVTTTNNHFSFINFEIE